MKQTAKWTPLERVLYTSLVPLVAVIAVVTALTYLQHGEHAAAGSSARAVAPTPQEVAESRMRAQRDEIRQTYRDCLKSMGVSIGNSRFRSRFAARPDMNKIRDGIAFCRNLLEQPTAPARARAPKTLPVA